MSATHYLRTTMKWQNWLYNMNSVEVNSFHKTQWTCSTHCSCFASVSLVFCYLQIVCNKLNDVYLVSMGERLNMFYTHCSCFAPVSLVFCCYLQIARSRLNAIHLFSTGEQFLDKLQGNFRANNLRKNHWQITSSMQHGFHHVLQTSNFNAKL